MKPKYTRRQFLASAGAMAASAGLLGSLTAKNAFAQETEGYKALVCVFFFGGLDNHDTILPLDQLSYNSFYSKRQQLMDDYAVSQDNSRARENLLPLTPRNLVNFEGRQYGLPSQLSELHGLFESQELSVIGSVGPLIVPTDRTQFNNKSVDLPKRLFSHNDQQSTWMALNVEGATRGWGGRLIDASLSRDSSLDKSYMGISTTTTETFNTGHIARNFWVSNNGTVRLDAASNRNVIGHNSSYNEARERISAFFQNGQRAGNNVFEQDYANMQAKGINLGLNYSDAFTNAVNLSATFPDTSLGQQLGTVAKSISIRQQLNAKRQVFFVGIGGFDTHSNQASSLPALQTQISQSIKAFRDEMVAQNVWEDVTLFTASDFGRTLNGNGSGTDHGWAGHHFVTGGSVRGGKILGHLPSSDTNSEEYTDNRGRLIPRVSVEQYAASMGKWFGLQPSDLMREFPNLASFNSSELDIFSI